MYLQALHSVCVSELQGQGHYVHLGQQVVPPVCLLLGTLWGQQFVVLNLFPVSGPEGLK